MWPTDVILAFLSTNQSFTTGVGKRVQKKSHLQKTKNNSEPQNQFGSVTTNNVKNVTFA